MAFDEGVDAMGLAESHAKRVLALEEAQAKKLLEVYGRVATSLRARLARLPEDTFTAQQLRVVLVQVEAAILLARRELQSAVLDSAESISAQGASDLATEVDAFNAQFRGALQPVAFDQALVALQSSNLLINQFQVSVETYSTDIRNQIADGLQQMIIERATPEMIQERLLGQKRIEKFFLGEAWRLRRIVRTEMHNIYSTAKRNSLRRAEKDAPGLLKTLYHPLDLRTADDSKHVRGLKLRVPVDEPFEYTWKGRQRVFQQPPDRPNDRSILIPYHPSWN